MAYAGGMTTSDPLCTEQFRDFDITMLKVVTDPGYVFTGWTVNGEPAKQATGPLFLTTRSRSASRADPLPPGTTEVNVQGTCFTVTVGAPDTVKRDEIFDVTLTLNPLPLWDRTTVMFDLAGQKTQNVPGRGEVQIERF